MHCAFNHAACLSVSNENDLEIENLRVRTVAPKLARERALLYRFVVRPIIVEFLRLALPARKETCKVRGLRCIESPRLGAMEPCQFLFPEGFEG